MNAVTPPARRHPGLRVEVIDTYADFLSAEADWKALEARDPETTVFLSWDWLAQAFRDNPYRWSVLALRAPGPDAGFACLMPLKYRTHWSTTRNEFQTELEAGGRLLFSEYTGFLCDPEFEALAMKTLAMSLRAMPWSRLSLRYVAQERRASQRRHEFEQAVKSKRSDLLVPMRQAASVPTETPIAKPQVS